MTAGDAQDPPRAGERTFFLAGEPLGGEARLRTSEARHAVRVVRLRPGDRIWGLDGAGRSWPLSVDAVERGVPKLGVAGDPILEPAPGEQGAPLPWIEAAVSLPRAGRAEDMFDRLVQLGLGALRPLVCARTQGGASRLSAARRQRLRRTAEEACKQSRRAWLPPIHPACAPAELAGESHPAALALLDRGAPTKLIDWARDLGGAARATRERPLVFVVGPEGGLTPEERSVLEGAGATALSIGPHVLRIETAAEAALAALVQVLFEG